MKDRKKIKDTKLGEWLQEKAPKVLETVGDLLPDSGGLGVVKNLISKEPGVDPEEAQRHVLKMVETQSLNCHSGKQIPCEIDSVCIHGDNQSSLATAKSIKNNLVENGLELKTLKDMKKFI